MNRMPEARLPVSQGVLDAGQRASLDAAPSAKTRRATGARIFLSLVLVSAAMPVTVAQGVPIVNSIRILDILLLFAALTLVLDLAYRPLELGYRQVFWILALLVLVSLVSVVWSQDRTATVRALTISLEGLVGYLFVVRELDGLSPRRVVAYFERFLYLLLIPAVFLLLRVPGFEPAVDPDVSRTSGEYLRYFTRLSHPILGSSNNLAAVLVLLVPVLVYWGHVRKDRRISIAGLVGAIAIILTLSRGTLLAFVVAAAVYAMVTAGSRGRRLALGRKIVLIAAIGGVALASVYAFNPATRELLATRLSLRNFELRLQLLTDAWSKIESHPVLGYGAGVAPQGDLALGEEVHNAFLQQVLYYGIPLGFAACVLLCALVGFFIAKRRKTAIAGVAAFTLMVELVSFLFQSSFEGTIHRVLFYMLVGALVALVRSSEVERGAGKVAAS